MRWLIGLVLIIAAASSACAKTPDVQAEDIHVDGPDMAFTVVVNVTSRENASYRVEVEENEDLTVIGNGSSEEVSLSEGEVYSFRIPMKSGKFSGGKTVELRYSVYENDVLVYTSTLKVAIEPEKVEEPLCQTKLILPLMLLTGAVMLVRRYG